MLPRVNELRYAIEIPSLKKSIEYTPYTVGQEKNLMIAIESKNDKQIMLQTKQLLRECIKTVDVDVDKLTTFDVELLFLNLRCKSVGEQAKIALPCPECDAANEVKIDLGNIVLTNELTDDFKIVISEEDGIGVTVRYPTINDSALDPNLSDSESAYNLIANCLVNIYTKDEMFDCAKEGKKEIVAFLDNLYEPQFKKIANFFNNIPSIKTDLSYTCSNCGHTDEQEVRGLKSFFT